MKEWISAIRIEKRTISKQIREIKRSEAKSVRKLKANYKKTGSKEDILPIAKALLGSHKEIRRLEIACARLESLMSSIKLSSARSYVSDALQNSSKIMTALSSSIKLPQLQRLTKNMAKEIFNAGLIEEQIDDSFAALETEDLEEQAQGEVDKVLTDILGESFAGINTPSSELPKSDKKKSSQKETKKKGGCDCNCQIVSLHHSHNKKLSKSSKLENLSSFSQKK